ncbi:MAG: N5-carboxyaminoimidazole ribonucleotide mutase [Phycisphaerales bacterium]|nr:N5-carboxyaminoimidazole ribonucleotide mutase [Phycisphaerales bacterium]
MPSSDNPPAPLVGIIMGSKSDWPTMKAAADLLAQLEIPHESRVVSAHRTPDLMAEYAKSAAGRGLLCIIAGAGGAAHLPGMVAAHTVLPVIGVPVKSHALAGLDSLLSIAQMPAGVPVGTVPIGDARAAGLVAARIVAVAHSRYADALRRIDG